MYIGLLEFGQLKTKPAILDTKLQKHLCITLKTNFMFSVLQNKFQLV